MKVKLNRRKMDKFVKQNVGTGMKRAAYFVEGEVKQSLAIGQEIEWRTSKKGKRYPVGKDPSKPPDPPHTLLGRLKQSIANVVNIGHRDIKGYVGTNVEYARRLELGYVGRDARGKQINQEPRPYLRKAIWENGPKIVKLIAKGKS
jgi:phage gpG-like protein